MRYIILIVTFTLVVNFGCTISKNSLGDFYEYFDRLEGTKEQVNPLKIRLTMIELGKIDTQVHDLQVVEISKTGKILKISASIGRSSTDAEISNDQFYVWYCKPDKQKFNYNNLLTVIDTLAIIKKDSIINLKIELIRNSFLILGQENLSKVYCFRLKK